jgi:glycosyltransferase involved in cell wall biosynthesis
MAVVAEMQGWPQNQDHDLAAQMEWEIVRRAHAVVDSSGTIVKMLAERYGVRPGSKLVREIPFGIRLPAMAAPRQDSEVRILFVGRLENRKGFDVLVQAIPSVLKGNPNARFWIAGEGNAADPAVREVNELARKNPGRIELFGWVNDARRDELYAGCDVFVAPSRYESFGLVYLEAMARGKACIACEAGGAGRIVIEGETGRLVPPGDGCALAAAIVDLARDRDKRIRMGALGRTRVETEFSVERMVERTLALYDELLEGRSVRSQEPAEALFR